MSSFEKKERTKQYFMQPGFTRLLQEIWKKYTSLGRVGGKVVLDRLSDEECEAINGFFGLFKQSGEKVEVSLTRFEEELQNSPFPSTIPELYLTLMGKPLLTRSESLLQQEDKWKDMFRSISSEVENVDELKQWLNRLYTGETPGYHTIRRVYRSHPKEAKRIVLQVVNALIHLRSGDAFYSSYDGEIQLDTVRLPVLAAKITGDSHAFDWKEPAGRLLWYGITEMWRDSHDERVVWGDDQDLALDPFTIREGYRKAGIGDDDLSSQVLFCIPDLRFDIQPTVWTLRQVNQQPELNIFASLYVVENPSVFSTLLDVTQQFRKLKKVAHGWQEKACPILLCTNGQPSVATLQLIELLLEKANSEVRLHYSGDFDVAGLQMAQAMAKRFATAFAPWRMDAKTYNVWSGKGPAFSREEIDRLQRMEIPWDASLTNVMAQKGHKLFQEVFVAELVEDWLEELGKLK
ncbi:hypothetical protein C1X05_03755 [Laceyella sacchari]|nr:hypothetical protein C1X05_03755 [Laceyella sacchari]